MQGLYASAAAAGLLCGIPSDIDRDEVAAFFPTYATLEEQENGTDAAGQPRPVWRVRVHCWVFEPEDDVLRGHGLRQFAHELGLNPEIDPQVWDRFSARAWPFVVDNERGQQFAVEVEESRVKMGPTAPDGHAHATVELAAEGVADQHTVEVRAVLPPGDERRFVGRVHLIGPEGVSVISDIDDTLKVSEVRDLEALLRRTFLLEHEAVEGMAALYREWEEAGAAFHYLTASPWQLHATLEDFLADEGFPRGSMHMREFRWKDERALDLLAPSGPWKRAQIAALLADFPERRFVLVGDSGEEDPEVYAELAREHVGQVAAILIRNVTEEGAGAVRWESAFAGLDEGVWEVFEKAEEVGDVGVFEDAPPEAHETNLPAPPGP